MIIWHNDNFIGEDEKEFSAQERILRYGDGFFESMIAVNARVLWLLEHYERIVLSAKVLKLDLPESFTKENFARILSELLQKNDLKNARFRAVFYRKGEGLYLPPTNEAGIFITCSENLLINDMSVLEKTAKVIERVEIFVEKKAKGSLSNVKSCNALLFVMASIFAKENDLQEAIILNSDDNICEAITANVFIIKDNRIITPSLTAGCVAGVMRTKLLRELNAIEKEISITEILAADAVFLTNVSKGVQVVRAIGDKKYDINLVKPIYTVYQKMLEKELA